MNPSEGQDLLANLSAAGKRSSELQRLIDDVQSKRVTVNGQLDMTKKEISKLREAFDAVVKAEATAATIKKQTSEVIQSEALKSLKTAVGVLRRAINDLRKGEAKAAAAHCKARSQRARSAAQGEEISFPVCTALEAKMEAGKLENIRAHLANMPKHFFQEHEAFLMPAGRCQSQLGQPVLKLSYYGSQRAWLVEHLQKTGHTSAHAKIMWEAVAKQVNKLLTEHLEANLFKKLDAGADAGWLEEILAPQFWLMQHEHAFVSNTPFLISECRLLLEGRTLVAGVPTEKAPGVAIADKIKHLRQMTVDELTN